MPDPLILDRDLAQKFVFTCGIEPHSAYPLIEHHNIVHIEEADVGQVFRDDPLNLLVGGLALFRIGLASPEVDETGQLPDLRRSLGWLRSEVSSWSERSD